MAVAVDVEVAVAAVVVAVVVAVEAGADEEEGFCWKTPPADVGVVAGLVTEAEELEADVEVADGAA